MQMNPLPILAIALGLGVITGCDPEPPPQPRVIKGSVTAERIDANERESMWQLQEKIHHDWIATKPKSMAAQVAHADFLASYAWQARGGGYADTVTEDGWRLFSREQCLVATNM